MQTLTHTKVNYNKSARNWEAWSGDHTQALHTGQITAFPAGPAGKRAALLHALTVESPPVAAEVDALIQMVIARGFPHLVDRILRAGFTVARGQVKQPRPLAGPYSYVGEVARVESSRDPGNYYAVVFSQDNSAEMGHTCECADSANGVKRHVLGPGSADYPVNGAPHLPGFGYACKHALAYYIAGRVAEYEWIDESIPIEGEPVLQVEL